MEQPKRERKNKKGNCSLPDCNSVHLARGYCSKHYKKFRKYGDPLAEADRYPETCSIDGCGKPTHDLGMCGMHALRFRKSGDVGPVESLKPGVLRHGTALGYSNYKCRCTECREAKRVRDLEWRAANREKVRDYQTLRRAKNPERERAYKRRWARANPHKSHRQSAARAAAPFDSEALDYAELIIKDPCVFCGSPSTDIDHIHPVSISKSSHWMNLAAACDSCNSSKGAKSLLEFMDYRIKKAELIHADTATNPDRGTNSDDSD